MGDVTELDPRRNALAALGAEAHASAVSAFERADRVQSLVSRPTAQLEPLFDPTTMQLRRCDVALERAEAAVRARQATCPHEDKHGNLCGLKRDHLQKMHAVLMPDGRLFYRFHAEANYDGDDWCCPVNDPCDTHRTGGALTFRRPGRAEPTALGAGEDEVHRHEIWSRIVDPDIVRDFPPYLREVLFCLLEGESAKDIATRTHRRYDTVRGYVGELRAAFGAHSIAAMLMAAVRGHLDSCCARVTVGDIGDARRQPLNVTHGENA